MSSNLSSTGATCGSGCRSMGRRSTSPPPSNETSNNRSGQDNHPNSSADPPSTSQHDEYYNNRIASYLADNTHEHPHFDETLIEDKVHTTQMKSYLDSFDDIMGGSDH
ncbi:hypothetical protein IFR05_009081 [Cadophora sp. M221]|nr:hypothetical protein IFR05_009081 [Cadophora sp. M221]